jgi:hypothetical protein
MSNDPAHQDADVVEETTTTQRKHDDTAAADGGGGSTGQEEPDVLLDVSELEVDRIR